MPDTPTLRENLPTELREQAGWNRDDAGLAGALLAAGDEIERLQTRVRQLEGEEHRLDIENERLRADRTVA